MFQCDVKYRRSGRDVYDASHACTHAMYRA